MFEFKRINSRLNKLILGIIYLFSPFTKLKNSSLKNIPTKAIMSEKTIQPSNCLKE